MQTLYHVTTLAALPAILEGGLDPARSQSSLDAVFLSGGVFTAASYACMRDGPHVMLSVDLSALDAALLGPDNYELPDLLEQIDPEALEELGYYEGVGWSEVSWKHSLAIADQVAYRGIIPPSALSIIDCEWIPAPEGICAAPAPM